MNQIAARPGSDADAVADYLSRLAERGFKGDIRADRAARLVTATDNSIYQTLPDAVVYPADESDVELLAALAAEPTFAAISFRPRGGGTGTNGQSLGDGVVVDMSKHLNHIIDFDEQAQTVTVQPGVVLDQLNAFLGEKGFFFPPMVSTSSRATLGGMTSTDASGKGSRIYGKVSDYLLAVDAVLADGTSFLFKALGAEELAPVLARPDRVGEIHRVAHGAVTEKRELIEATFPKMNRGLTGYNLKQALTETGGLDMTRLIAGSEGSLCFLKRLTFRVIPKPKNKGLVVVSYATFNEALDGVATLLQADPAAIEIVDDKIMGLAQTDIVWNDVAGLLERAPEDPPVAAMNFVEFVGDSAEEVDAQIDRLVQVMIAARAGGEKLDWRRAENSAQIAALWEMRKRAVGLLGGLQGKRRAIPFVEDTAVPPENLPEFIRGFRQILDKHGVDYGMFGHADVGCLHVRPTLDLTEPEDEIRVREISDQVSALCQTHGGLLWGEHGKGYRGEYVPDYFGPELYAELRKIKAAFDPENKLNPGKITTPYGFEQIRPTAIDAVPLRAHFDKLIAASLKEDYAKAVLCNGNGACFNWDAADPMCPSYKVSRDRVQSPKGRAGLLREWLRMKSETPGSPALRTFEEEVHASLSTCLACKACAGQCPVKVDIPEMKSAFMAEYYETRSRPWRDYVVAKLEAVAPLAARMPRLVNAVQGSGLAKTAMARLFGLVDLPAFSKNSTESGLKQLGIKRATVSALRAADKDRSVVLVREPLTDGFDAEVVLDHVRLLKRLGYTVFVTKPRPLGKPLHVKGFLSAFDKLAQANDAYFAALAATGVPLIGIDAAITLQIRLEYKQRLADRPDYKVHLFQEWLADEIAKDGFTPPMASSAPVRLFSHCTEKTAAPASVGQWAEIFKSFGIELEKQNTGCCGMAGVYGHEAEHVESSKKLYAMSWAEKIRNADGLVAVTGFSCRCQVKRAEGSSPQHPVQILMAALR